MISVRRITLEDNLQQLVDEINQASWDAANDMCDYGMSALCAYLERQDTVFIACHDFSRTTRTLLGIASARLEIKPYGTDRWLYIDEVDVCADQRCRGVGKALMQKLLEIAQEMNCEEVWLGTEIDNQAANALYQSLSPDDVSQFVGYTYEI